MRRIICVLLIATACAKDVTAPAPSLLVTTSVSRDSIRAGDTVSVLVTVYNRSAEPQTISGGGCGFIGFDVTDSTGAVVGGPPSQFCAAFLALKVLAPGDQYAATLTWTGTALGGPADEPPTFLSPGAYFIDGGAALSGPDGSTVSQSGIELVPAHITIVR